MKRETNGERRCILGVFAHPDDETAGAGGTFTRYAGDGVEIHVATATLGERGTLGTGGLQIKREELPAVREAELRAVLQMFGARPPILLGYRDGELASAEFADLVSTVTSTMERVGPDVVITFGPTGVSHHDDHVTIHRAALAAFDLYVARGHDEARLFYVAIPEELARRFELDLDPSERSPTVIIDIGDVASVKTRGLRTYRSQEDAQELAAMFEEHDMDFEAFHQARPPAAGGPVKAGFWQ